MPPGKAPPPAARAARNALERLYIYWLTSVLLLILLAALSIVLVRGALQRQTDAISALQAKVSRLEIQLQEAQTAAPPPAETTRAPTEPTRRPDETRRPRTTPDEYAPPGVTGLQPAPAAAAAQGLDEATLRMRLDQVLPSPALIPSDIRDADAALKLLEEADRSVPSASWNGSTWARLATLARLLGQDAAAARLARRAASAGGDPTEYLAATTRMLLARGAADDALPLVSQLVEQTRGVPTARVLLAATLITLGNDDDADETVALLAGAGEMALIDRLLLGRILLALERWDELDALMSGIKQVPDTLAAEYGFLLAAGRAHAGNTVEALAILDGLRADLPPARTSGTAARIGHPWQALPPAPDLYEIETWRGVALLRAGQRDAAQEVLQQAASLSPGRPDAHYQLGVLEAQRGRPEIAALHFKNALASSARYAPAWEALALLEIDTGELDAALEHVARALDVNIRRPAAHFLRAIAHAKRADHDQAAAALQEAVRLDQRYVDKALQIEVFQRLFTPEELQQMAGGGRAAETPPPGE